MPQSSRVLCHRGECRFFEMCNSHPSCLLHAFQTSQNIDIVRWGPAEPHYENSLRGHTRTVTDIDWHSKNPNLLVSCSIDTFSHIWDLRDPRKPALSLNAVCMCNCHSVKHFLLARLKLSFVRLQRVQLRLALIASRAICWPPPMTVICAFGTYARAAAQRTILPLI